MEINDTNETVWNELFFKKRSLGKCLSVGVAFFSNRFLKILQLAIPAVLLASFMIAIVVYSTCDASIEMAAHDSFLYKSLHIAVLLISFSLLVAFTYRCVDVSIEGLNIYSVGYKFIYNKQYAKDAFCALVINILCFSIVALMLMLARLFLEVIADSDEAAYNFHQVSFKTIITYSLALVIAVVTIVPLFMSQNYMMLRRNHFLSDIKQGYLMGWNKWGRVFALEIMVSIFVAILSIFILSPTYVISLMQHSATLSRLQGDIVVLPGYFYPFTFTILFISSLFISLIMIVRFLPHAYLYASVMSEKEENDAKSND